MKHSFSLMLKALLLSIAAAGSATAQTLIDTNNNGMSDVWERHFNDGELLGPGFLSTDDADGDGWSNMKESIAGTDPRNPVLPEGFIQKKIRHVPATWMNDPEGGEPMLLTPEAFEIEWPTVFGKNYKLFFSEDLESWIDTEYHYYGWGDIHEVVQMPEYAEGGMLPRGFWKVNVEDAYSDDDGVSDYEENLAGTNPLDAETFAGLPDAWVILHFQSAWDFDPLGDEDGDELSNFEEFLNGTSPLVSDTDGDGVDDDIEVEQGSDPVNGGDEGAAPTDIVEEVPFTVGGDYAARQLTVTGKGPRDFRQLKVTSPNPGATETRNLKLWRDNRYEITMVHAKSIDDWYCWEAAVDGKPGVATFPEVEEWQVGPRNDEGEFFTVAGHWLVDNRSGLLSGHLHSEGTNVVGSLKAEMVPVKVEWEEISGFENLEAHTDPWTNEEIGMRIFPGYKNPSDSVIRHKLKLVVKSSPVFSGLTMHVKAFDVDDTTSEEFDKDYETHDPVIDPNGKAGDDNLADYFATPQSGQFWENGAWGDNVSNKEFDSNGRAEFDFRVGMQPGSNYRIVASLDAAKCAEMQVGDPDGGNYLAPSEAPESEVFTSPLLTVWRRLWVENDSMKHEDDAASGYENYLSVFVLDVSTTQNSNGMITVTPGSVPSVLPEHGFRFVSGSDSSVWPIISMAQVGNHGVAITQGVPTGEQTYSRIYDNDGYGLDREQLPRLDLVNDQMKGYFRTSFVHVVDAVDYNPNKLIPFRPNEDISVNGYGQSSTIVNSAKDLTDMNALWVCPISAAFQGPHSTDGDPDIFNQGEEQLRFGETASYSGADHSVVFVEACRELYNDNLRSKIQEGDAVGVGKIREAYEEWVIAVIAHEMGHQPSDQNEDEDHAEMELMSEGVGAPTDNAKSARFSANSVIRFRRADRWSD